MINSSKTIGILRANGWYLVLLAVMLAGSFALAWSQNTVNAKTAAAEEQARPANVSLTVITASDCADCFDAAMIVSGLKSGPFNIEEQAEVSSSSEEGKSLVERYGVARLPTVILEGEVSKDNAKEFLSGRTAFREGVAVWTLVPPPYLDTSSGTIVGRVKLTLLDDRSCEKCYDPAMHRGILSGSFGLPVTETLTVDVASTEGRRLRSEYGIEAVPTAILSSDASSYDALVRTWPQLGTIEDDGSFVFRQVQLLNVPYKDLKSGKIIESTNNN